MFDWLEISWFVGVAGLLCYFVYNAYKLAIFLFSYFADYSVLLSH